MKTTTTMIYITQTKDGATTKTKIESVGDRPSESMAKQIIKELLPYAGKINEIR